MKQNLFIPDQKTPHFSMRSLTVTVKRDLSSLKQTLSEEELKLFIDLHLQAELYPKKASKEVEQLLSCYPHQTEILNLLTYLFLKRRKVRKANALIIQNYTHNPTSLFARINYADYCLRKKKIEEIPKIFDQNFDLRSLYPDRSSFHLSEFRGFMVLLSFYHLAIQQKDAAECYFYIAHTVDKAHTSVQLLKKKLYRKPLYKKIFKMGKR